MYSTTDRNLRYQQNLSGRRIAVVILGKGPWLLIKKRLSAIATAVAGLKHLDQPIGIRARQRPQEGYLWVEDADALAAEFKRRGVKFIVPVGEREYGCRDFIVDDCNGYRLCFGHNI